MADDNEESISRHLYREYFVNPNDDEHSLLSDKERELGMFVYPIVEETFETHLRNIGWERPNEFYQALEFQGRMIYPLEYMLILLEFSRLDSALDQFTAGFSSFEENRIHSVASIREIVALTSRDRQTYRVAVPIDQNLDGQNVNAPRSARSYSGIIGGAALIACLFLPPVGLAIIPAGVAVGHYLTSSKTIAITEQMREKINETRRVLRTDREIFQATKEWLRHSLLFVEATEGVLSIHMMERLARSLRQLDREAPDFNDRFQNSIQAFLEELLTNMEIGPLTAPLLPITITTLAVLFVSDPRRYFVFDSIVLTSHQFQEFTNGMEVRHNIAQINNGAAHREERRLPTDVRELLDNVFKGIDITFAATNMLAVDISLDGSFTERTAYCTRAANTLERELDFFRRIHDGISILPQNHQ